MKSAALLAAIFAASFSAYGWGQNGHRIVGRIAENHLSKKATQSVKALLGPDTLAEVATWPDEIRSDPEWKKADPWHFINIDDNETYETAQKNPAGDVVREIRRFRAVLKDSQAGANDKKIALKFLVHLVGDIHQPLHVGRRADQGGNKISVTWMGKPTNLHTVWDSEMIESQQLSFSEFVTFLDPPTSQQVKQWQAASDLDWVKESFGHRAAVYAIGDGKLSFAYGYTNLPLVKTRLLQAGVRLAGLLNSIFQ